MTDFLDLDAPARIKLRGRQPEWVQSVESAEAISRRLLVVAPGGIGKSSVMAVLAQRKWEAHGIRTLITENREHLVEQTAKRVRNETGLEVGVEMAGQHASPYDHVVVASVQSLGRPNRLLSFSDSHFGYVVPDECHLSLAPQPQRILRYFHWGADSLNENWVRPANGLYVPKSTVVGFTASPNLGEKRSLGEFFDHVPVNYSYLTAIEEGWLVGLKEENIPVKIDTRKFRTRRTTEGNDFNITDQTQAIIPVIRELAAQIVEHAFDRKTICFMPSVECARLMAEALNGMGMKAIFASGECIDKSEKTEAYNAAPPGTVFVNCALVVYGVDFPDTDCIAVFSAIISKVRYVQMIYRGTRVLPDTVSDEMTAEQRVAAIRRSRKPRTLVLSPFFISDRIDICEAFDMFSDIPHTKRAKKEVDMTSPGRIRDAIGTLEKEAIKSKNRERRTIDPVRYALSLGDRVLANYVPQSSADAAPPSKTELDFLFEHDIDSSAIKSSGQAQKMISTILERERLGLATVKQLGQLTLRLNFPTEAALLVKRKTAGVLIGKGIHYSAPEEVPTGCYCSTTPFPPCAFCENSLPIE